MEASSQKIPVENKALTGQFRKMEEPPPSFLNFLYFDGRQRKGSNIPDTSKRAIICSNL